MTVGFWENIAFAAVVVVVGLVAMQMKALTRRIEANHPATWEALGRPTTQTPRRREILAFFSASWRTLAFVIAGRPERLEDPQLTRTAWLVRTLALVGALLVLAIAVLDPDGPFASLHR